MKFVNKIRFSRVFRVFLILTPFVLGFVGYLFYYSKIQGSEPIFKSKVLTYPILSALYSTIRLFAFSFDASAKEIVFETWARVFLEVARYWAGFLTGSALFKILKPYLEDLLTAIKAHAHNSIVLHGSPSITSVMKDHMDGYAVIEQNSSREKFKSGRHVIAFENDADALQFLQNNYKLISDSSKKQGPTTYLCVHSPELKLENNAAVRVSCMAENCARLFWNQYYVKRFSEGCAQHKETADPNKEATDPNKEATDPHRTKIVMIGFDTYGQALLNQALLVNVFPKGTAGIEYHIFGNGEAYLCSHPMLNKILSFDKSESFDRDYLQFHDKQDIYACYDPIIKDAERIILCDDNDMENYRVFSQLCRMTAGLPDIYIRAKSDQICSGLFNMFIPPNDKGNNNDKTDNNDEFYINSNAKNGDFLRHVKVRFFGKDEDLYTKDVIINQSLEEHAKAVHAKYMDSASSGRWEDIGTVKQYSNIAAADHSAVKIRQILKKDCVIDKGFFKFDKENKNLNEYNQKKDNDFQDAGQKNRLLEMEHTRWCRFYYLLGWSNANDKKEIDRVHNCLTEFSNLMPDTQKNDSFAFDVISTLFETKKPKRSFFRAKKSNNPS